MGTTLPIEAIQIGFDYTQLAPDVRAEVETATRRLHDLERRTSESIIEIGRELISVKAKIGHGNFLPWIGAEFGWSTSTATKMMQVAETFGDKNVTVTNLGAKVLYLLAAPSTPEDVRIEFTELAKIGKSVQRDFETFMAAYPQIVETMGRVVRRAMRRYEQEGRAAS